MSLSRGLIIKSGRPTLPQWRMRPRLRRVIAAPVIDTRYGVSSDGYVIGDANVLYINIYHDSATSRDISVYCTVDGVEYSVSLTGVTEDTWLYIYLDEITDTLDYDFNKILAGNDVTWFGWGFQVEVEANEANVIDLECVVRYQSL